MTEKQPRTLKDFGRLTPTEQRVLDELDTGRFIWIGRDVPDADAGEERLIRARFLRWVILSCDGSDKYRVHERGVRIAGALITGEGEDRTAHAALDLEGAEVPQDLALVNCRFTARPEMIGARMQSLILDRSHLPGLRADGLGTRGNVALDSIQSDGEIRLLGAQIGGDLTFTEGKIRNPGKTGRGVAINASKATIKGSLHFTAKSLGSPTIEGCVSLSGATIGAINDYPRALIEQGTVSLRLDGCTYKSLMSKEGKIADGRLEWLGLSPSEEAEHEFRPQPYEQCAKVLREMGHQDDARLILIKKEQLQREARRAKLSGPKLWWRGFWDRFLAGTVCYGQRPLNAGYWLAGLWLLGTVFFAVLHAHDQFKPNNAFVLRADEWANCSAEHAPPFAYLGTAGQSQLACFDTRPEAKGLPAFNPFVYSLDVLFPLVQLEQQVHWIPDEDQTLGWWGKALVYVQIVMGWLLSLLAVAGLSGIIKSD